tara:strand:+ start:269 stop:2644 length:2376 start_codon:yes stop_codon:yes gene_type:complete
LARPATEREQRILELWNARLNPPDAPNRIGDIEINLIDVQDRNELIDDYKLAVDRGDKAEQEELILDIKDLDDDVDFSLLGLDPFKAYSYDEIIQEQAKKSDTTFRRYEEKTLDDVRDFVNELSADISKEWQSSGLTGTTTEAIEFVYDNLFYNYELDSKQKAKYTDNVRRGVDQKENAVFSVLNSVSLEFSNSPQTLTKNDKFWTAIDAGIESGYYPPEVSLLVENKITSPEEANNLLLALDINAEELNQLYLNRGGKTGILRTLDDITANFIEGVDKVIEDTKGSARISGNTGDFYAELPQTLSTESGPELPRIGQELRSQQDQLRKFQTMGWNFNKSIEDNVKSIMSKNEFLNPNNGIFPEEWLEEFGSTDSKKNMGDFQRSLIRRLEESSFGKTYTDALNNPDKNPSLEMAFDVFNGLDGALGQDGQIALTQVQDALTEQKRIQDDKDAAEELQKQLEKAAQDRAEYREDLKDVLEREKEAKKFLEQNPRYRDILEGEGGTLFLREVANSVTDFESFDELLADEDFADRVDYLAGRMNPDEVPPLSSQAAEEIGATPGEPGLPGLIVRDPFPEPTDFDLESIAPQLREIAADRPEYAKFLMEQIQLPGFNEQFRKVSAPRLDEEGYLAAIGGGAQDGTQAFELQQRKLDAAQERYDRDYVNLVNKGEDTSESLAALEGTLDDAKRQFQMETGVDPATGERAAVGQAFMPGGFAREMARERFTIDATTAEDFFKQQLPGFQSRFEETPFFKLEQDRIKETQNREELKRRLPLLRTGGRGRTIVTTGRR